MRFGSLLAIFLAVGCGRGSQVAPAASPPAFPGFSGVVPSPLPNVTLGRLGPKLTTAAAYRGAYTFSTDWFTTNLPIWEKALAPYKGREGVRYLEVGAFEGRSLLWMLENVLTDPGARATVIDPFSGDLKDRFLANLEASGARRKVTVIVGYSQIELRKLPLDAFDVVYVDGSHFADDVLEDALLAWRLLRPGALLIFDDYQWRAGPLATNWPGSGMSAFYTFYGRHFDVVHTGSQLILRRRSVHAAEERVLGPSAPGEAEAGK